MAMVTLIHTQMRTMTANMTSPHRSLLIVDGGFLVSPIIFDLGQ